MTPSPKQTKITEIDLGIPFKTETDGNETITIELFEANDKYQKAIDLKAFYKEIHTHLYEDDYFDMMGEKKDQEVGKFFNHQAKKGEFPQNSRNLNRTGNMFEKKYVLKKKGKFNEFEFYSYAMKKGISSPYGWVEIHLDLQTRTMEDKEMLVGNQKVTLQHSSWEIRNKFLYKNTVAKDYLNKIPLVKNSPKIKQLYIEHLHKKNILADVEYYLGNAVEKINNIILKHFT